MFIHYQKCRIHPPTPEPVGVGDPRTPANMDLVLDTRLSQSESFFDFIWTLLGDMFGPDSPFFQICFS